MASYYNSSVMCLSFCRSNAVITHKTISTDQHAV